MSLLAEHKAERRARILKSARRLMGRKGYAGLTMRELARSSRVSVPTVYNLIGGKDALLEALMEELYANIVERVAAISEQGESSVVDRAWAVCRAGHDELLQAPHYARELMCAFLQSPETSPLRREMDLRFVEMMATILREGRRADEIVAWAEPVAVARSMYGLYTISLIAWSQGDIDDAQLRRTTEYGHALQLLGIARGAARGQLERLARETQPLTYGTGETSRSPRARKEAGA